MHADNHQRMFKYALKLNIVVITELLTLLFYIYLYYH